MNLKQSRIVSSLSALLDAPDLLIQYAKSISTIGELPTVC